jgi:xanthine dehydrogenase accessory factor
VTPGTLRALLAARHASRPVVLATRIPDGHQSLLPDDPAAPTGLREAAERALQRGESHLAEIAGQTWFLQVYAPPFRLLVVGAVHIAQALAPLAESLSYAVTVLDPRRAFASEDRFPGVTLSHSWPDEGLDAFGLDRRTAVVALTHDPKLDDPALDVALHSDAFFIGALGSRKTHAARLSRLADRGHAPEALARIRGPVGLALGAVTPHEIALSILAEIIAVRRGAPLGQR